MGRTLKINGLKVTDATKSIILHVTQRDIANAKKKDQAECAAAVACRRQLGASEVRVHLGRTYVRFNGEWKRYITSYALRDELIAFDRGGEFMAGDYTLVRMQPSRQWERKYRKNLKNRRVRKQLITRQPRRHVAANVRPVGIYA